MACLVALKQDIKILETTFPRNHDRFQILSASLDEIACQFIGKNGEKFVIHANITDTYPQTAPIWFAESEDVTVTNAIAQLCETSAENYNILKQFRMLICAMCGFHNVSEPQEISALEDAIAAKGMCAMLPGQRNDTSDEEEDEDDFHYDMEEDITDHKAKEEYNGIDDQNMKTLERLKQHQRQDYLQGSVAGSVQASDRLMKELKDIYKSDSYRKEHQEGAGDIGGSKGCYSVDLVNDSLYEWNVKFYKDAIDSDSPLHSDLIKLKQQENRDYILLNITFMETFPFDPPFVRVITPVLNGGYVLGGGAICMELLTKQGWSSAYSVESVILQITATLVKGKARITFGATKSQYSLARAKQSFKSLVQIHEKNGWFTPPKEDG
ncbi:unnamed protein product [Owenia fusiformis]|uniref:Uncharacterized protein n=1 Tax=Owenia fusiformis TaxID=6347 RepID=A0A8J1XUH9_OWEFU|nr:unnamed protein product [Owenia fusiformis]